ncbi:Transcriptional regulator, LuxR family [Streptococcus sp. DD10]|uniref:AAA family ATPase n=1 Tax=Streptococcus sp. DD10 TaxID=1777878 RepID=UPI0007998FD5|nr:AAA family ATPase [Streptococcus sp. DD10]KXT74385.1 Transcriptional regulator, LuxR family [Streptococcus sp. DD10]
MTENLRLKLFGQPKVFLGEKEVHFSFLKIEALLYYLVVMGQSHRDQVAGLLWAGKENQVARKNLRNTVYQANKVLGMDLIISPTRNSLSFNPQVVIESDVSRFMAFPFENLDLYQGDFLEGFYLKDDGEFEDWIERKRLFLQQLYVDSCQQVIQTLHSKDSRLEGYLKQLIALDEFEEKNYEGLLEFYRQNRQFGKFFDTYYALVDLLDRELGVRPSETIERLYQMVLMERREQEGSSQSHEQLLPFFGRRAEIRQLENFFSQLEGERQAQVLLLEGEFGLGKRRLLRQVLLMRTYAFHILRLDCSHKQSQRPDRLLRIFEENLVQLLGSGGASHFQKDQAVDLIVELLQTLLEERPFLLVFENAQFLEKDVLDLLEDLLGHFSREKLGIVLITTPQKPIQLGTYIAQLELGGRLTSLVLSPFSEKESRIFLRNQLPYIEEDGVLEMLEYGQGNPFFLTEYLLLFKERGSIASLPRLVKSHLNQLWGQLSKDQMDMLTYLSCFEKKIPFSLLEGFMTHMASLFMALVDDLSEKGLLEVTVEGDRIFLDFQQKVLKRYVYQNLSPAKKRLLHREIAQELEKGVRTGLSILVYKEIAYQYREAKEVLRALNYELQYLEAILEFRQELFPIYYKGYQGMEETGLKYPVDILKQLDCISGELQKMEVQYQRDREYCILRLRFLYLEGRYFIRIGDYQKGIHDIQEVVSSAKNM